MIDLLISEGTLIDGSGSQPFRADVAVHNGRITAVGDLSGMEAVRTISAAGRHVCPGFIDAHSHSDTYILLAPSAESKITQGITTEIVGNCGASAAPLIGSARLPSDWAAMDYGKTWRTVAEYRELVDAAEPAVNIVLLVGHNTLHGGVVGYENIRVTGDHLKQMSRVLDQALAEGAAGLSTGLLYAPGIFAAEEEVVELCRTVATRNRICTTHMRSETDRLLEALGETIRIAEKSGVRTQVSHLKTAGKRNWHLLDQALAMISSAIEAGTDIAADRYPYLASCTDLDVVLPSWAQEGSREEIISRLSDPDSRNRIVSELRSSRPDSDWSHVTIGSVSEESLSHLSGMALPEAADKLGLRPVEAVVEIITRDRLRTSAFFSGMSEENMLRILSQPYVMLGTDASLRTTTGVLGKDYPHPRAFGSFPRFLRMVIDRGFISLPEAVRKITSLPASQFGLHNRGLIKPGYHADIVVFDAGRILDTATYATPHSISQGVDAVIVNGSLTLLDGRISDRLTGRFLEPR